MSRNDCLTGRFDPKHLFTCPECRTDARLAHAWRGLGRIEDLEPAVEPDERFAVKVLEAVRADRVRTLRRRVALAAAAALLFSFFAGTADEAASRPAPTPEASYASLVSPNTLDDLIPN